jgi:hypothetical protein
MLATDRPTLYHAPRTARCQIDARPINHDGPLAGSNGDVQGVALVVHVLEQLPVVREEIAGPGEPRRPQAGGIPELDRLSIGTAHDQTVGVGTLDH